MFPNPFPSIDEISSNTWLIGVHIVQRRNDKKSGYSRKWNEGFVVSIVAVMAGERRSMGFDDVRGWRPLHEFTARFLASPQNRDEAGAKSVVETAVEQLLTLEPRSKIVLFLDAGRAAGSGTHCGHSRRGIASLRQARPRRDSGVCGQTPTRCQGSLELANGRTTVTLGQASQVSRTHFTDSKMSIGRGQCTTSLLSYDGNAKASHRDHTRFLASQRSCVRTGRL